MLNSCSSCKIPTCRICANEIYLRANLLFSNQETKDKFIENLWRECENIAFIENKDGELVLDQPWRGFPIGAFTQDDWFHWVDHHHSKGVGWVFENIS